MLLVTLLCASPVTLEAAVDEAHAHARDMILAREDVILVDADYLEALSAILPRLDVRFSAGEVFSGQQIVESRNPVPVQLPTEFPQVEFGRFVDAQANNYSHPALSLSLSGRQLIFDGGRWWTVLGRVGDLRAARAAALEVMSNVVRAQVVRAFYELEKSRQAITTFREQLRVDEDQVQRARDLVDVGRGSPADVATAQRNLARDQILMRDFRVREGQARRAFNLQLGRSPRAPAELVIPGAVATATGALEGPAIPDLDRLVELSGQNRPELRDLTAQVESAKKQVDVAIADYWPIVSLETRYARNSRRPDRIFNNPFENYFATVDLVLQWNLFEGLGTKARVERAAVELRKQVARYEALQREMVADVEDRQQELLRQRAVYALAQRQITAAVEAVRLARGLFESGRGTALELRDAELGLTQAKLTAINARLDIEIARSDLIRAVGTDPWSVSP